MGQQIGLQSAVHGFEVAFYDLREEAFESAKKRIKRLQKNFYIPREIKEKYGEYFN